MDTPATRLITLILLLQREPNQKAADLADKLGVSVRTLHRYFDMLDKMGIPVYTKRGPHGGFSLVRGYKLPPLIFTPEEAVAVYLGTSLVRQVWGQLYSQAAQGAMAKLDNILPGEQRAEIGWAQRSLITIGLLRSDLNTLSPLLEKIRQGVRQHQQLCIIYQNSTKAEITKRQVDPYALVYRNGWWYLVGFCHLRQAFRTFRIDHIQSLDLLNKDFQFPEDFNIQAYIDTVFKDQPVVRARLRFVPAAAHIAKANPLSWKVIHENPDGSVEVDVEAPDLSWLASLVLSFATWVTVLEPQELRSLVREWALATATIHQDDAI